jgi:hypothetical protein
MINKATEAQKVEPIYTDYSTYAFTAHSAETLYGYGTENEAYCYLEWLNNNRGDIWNVEVSGLTDEEAIDRCFNLADELGELRI